MHMHSILAKPELKLDPGKVRFAIGRQNQITRLQTLVSDFGNRRQQCVLARHQVTWIDTLHINLTKVSVVHGYSNRQAQLVIFARQPKYHKLELKCG